MELLSSYMSMSMSKLLAALDQHAASAVLLSHGRVW